MLPVENTLVEVQPPQKLSEIPKEGLSATVDESIGAIPEESPDNVRNKEEQDALRKELKQFFEDLKALCPVCHASIKAGAKLLKLYMFMVENI
jgi:hypothetical protein